LTIVMLTTFLLKLFNLRNPADFLSRVSLTKLMLLLKKAFQRRYIKL
jgi:hypothetical protein